MSKPDNIMWLDMDKGIPSATIAKYGITLNSLATKIVSRHELVRIGYQKLDNALIIGVSSLEEQGGEVPEGWFLVSDKITPNGYFRLNNKDLVRLIARYAKLDLHKRNRFMAEWDEVNSYLVVNLAGKLDTEKR